MVRGFAVRGVRRDTADRSARGEFLRRLDVCLDRECFAKYEANGHQAIARAVAYASGNVPGLLGGDVMLHSSGFRSVWPELASPADTRQTAFDELVVALAQQADRNSYPRRAVAAHLAVYGVPDELVDDVLLATLSATRFQPTGGQKLDRAATELLSAEPALVGAFAKSIVQPFPQPSDWRSEYPVTHHRFRRESIAETARQAVERGGEMRMRSPLSSSFARLLPIRWRGPLEGLATASHRSRCGGAHESGRVPARAIREPATYFEA